MTWGEFKAFVKSSGVQDLHEIDRIDVMLLTDAIRVTRHGDGFFSVDDENYDDEDETEAE